MNLRHGHSIGRSDRTHNIWGKMRQRCQNPNDAAYLRYGGRGIKVCERWRIFENFLADMGEAPIGKTLDRFPNNDGNYEPKNCRWATPREQALNRRPFTEKTKLKLSLARTGSKASAESRRNQSLAQMRRKLSAETRKKISEGRKRYAERILEQKLELEHK